MQIIAEKNSVVGVGGKVRDAKHRWLGFQVMVEGRWGRGGNGRDAKQRWLGNRVMVERRGGAGGRGRDAKQRWLGNHVIVERRWGDDWGSENRRVGEKSNAQTKLKNIQKIILPSASIEDAISNAKEAIELYIESLREHGEPIPTEEGTLEYMVAVEANAYRYRAVKSLRLCTLSNALHSTSLDDSTNHLELEQVLINSFTI